MIARAPLLPAAVVLYVCFRSCIHSLACNVDLKNALQSFSTGACPRMPSPALAKVDDKVSAAALQALQNLTKHTKRCAAFVYEVDPEELGLVNYFDIITEPMHLDLVREKLEVTFVVRMLVF